MPSASPASPRVSAIVPANRRSAAACCSVVPVLVPGGKAWGDAGADAGGLGLEPLDGGPEVRAGTGALPVLPEPVEDGRDGSGGFCGLLNSGMVLSSS